MHAKESRTKTVVLYLLIEISAVYFFASDLRN